MAKHVFLTGSLGTGHAMKALNNLVSAGGLWIASEALLIGERFGLSPERIVDILNASTGRNNSTENKFKQHILSRSFASGFSLGLMAKDLRVAADLAAATGQASPLTRLCTELWNEAESKLGGSQDHTAIVKVLEAGAEGGSPRQVARQGRARRRAVSSPEPFEIYAIRYATMERRADEVFIGGDPHAGPDRDGLFRLGRHRQDAKLSSSTRASMPRPPRAEAAISALPGREPERSSASTPAASRM